MNEGPGDVRALIEQIAKALVDEPTAVSVTVTDGGADTLLELAVAENDMGKVIGKQGRTVRAMRALLNAAGIRAQKRYTLEIIE